MFDSSIYHLIKFKQTLYITAETELVETEDPGEIKINEVIKFCFKDLRLQKNICELQTDKLAYDVAFVAHDLSPTDSIVVVMTCLAGETKTPRLLKFTQDEDGKWINVCNNGELINLKTTEVIKHCFVLQNRKVLLVLSSRLIVYSADLAWVKEIKLKEIHNLEGSHFSCARPAF